MGGRSYSLGSRILPCFPKRLNNTPFTEVCVELRNGGLPGWGLGRDRVPGSGVKGEPWRGCLAGAMGSEAKILGGRRNSSTSLLCLAVLGSREPTAGGTEGDRRWLTGRGVYSSPCRLLPAVGPVHCRAPTHTSHMCHKGQGALLGAPWAGPSPGRQPPNLALFLY